MAALFNLTLEEKKKVSLYAINFAIGPISAIVDSVCVSIEVSVLGSLESEINIILCFVHENLYSSLRTVDQQS